MPYSSVGLHAIFADMLSLLFISVIFFSELHRRIYPSVQDHATVLEEFSLRLVIIVNNRKEIFVARRIT